MSLQRFLRVTRAAITCDKASVRVVSRSELARADEDADLAMFIADKAPLYYRDPEHVIRDLKEGFFLSALKKTLLRLPTSAWFQQSHFAEIIASLFAEEVLGYTRLYCKLSTLTAENANANKMDLLLFDSHSGVPRFVFGEVKSSVKHAKDGLPADHRQGCLRDLRKTIGDYSDRDREFDIAAITDRLRTLPDAQAQKIREGLRPYAKRVVAYMGIAVIDTSTYADTECVGLLTRPCEKSFDAEVLCVEEHGSTALATFNILEGVRSGCLK
jgi:hypothetical protein